MTSTASTESSVKQVSILVLPESSIMSFASIIDPLRAANRLSRNPIFNWEILSLDGNPVTLTCNIDIPVDGAFNEHHKGDALIVLAGFSHQRHVTKVGLKHLRNSKSQYKVIAAVEAGTWILARAGVITHHSVTTHWEDTENLAEAYPQLDVRTDRYVIDGHIWSCGGASPALDMMLHYIRIVQNRSLALDIASVFIYSETAPAAESQPIVSLGRINEIEPRLAIVINLMEVNIEDPIRIKMIANRAGLSKRMLEKLIKKYLGTSPAVYYLRLRLQIARRLVLDTNLSIQDISVRCGFNSQAAFLRAFKRRYNCSARFLRQQTP